MQGKYTTQEYFIRVAWSEDFSYHKEIKESSDFKSVLYALGRAGRSKKEVLYIGSTASSLYDRLKKKDHIKRTDEIRKTYPKSKVLFRIGTIIYVEIITHDRIAENRLEYWLSNPKEKLPSTQVESLGKFEDLFRNIEFAFTYRLKPKMNKNNIKDYCGPDLIINNVGNYAPLPKWISVNKYNCKTHY